MGLITRLLGICATQVPLNSDCWTVKGSQVEIKLDRARELTTPGGAIRLEGSGLPRRLLVFRGGDGELHAFVNKCSHMGRRLDPVGTGSQVQCCSVGGTTFDLTGNRLSGLGRGDVKTFPVAVDGNTATIDLS